MKHLQKAKDIVKRYRERGFKLPKEQRDVRDNDPVKRQEHRDACKIKRWRYALMGNVEYSCDTATKDYLDTNMPDWCEHLHDFRSTSRFTQMRAAKATRKSLHEHRRSPHGIQQLDLKKAILSTGSTRREGGKLNCSSKSFKTTKSLNKSRLDHSLPNSSSDNASRIASCRRGDFVNLKKKRLSFHHTTGKVPPDVSALVQRYEARGCVLPSLSLKCRRSSSRRQEYKDAMQLQRWKNLPQVLTVKELSLLNAKMPGWKNIESTHKDNTKENSFMRRKNMSLTQNLLKARDIVKRCSNRRQKGQNILPRFLSGDCMQMDVELTLECIDAKELCNWKQAFLADGLQAGGTKGKGIAWELKAFLDKELHEWLSITPTYRERGSDSILSGLKRKRDYFSHLGKIDFVECERDVKLVVADATVVPYPRSSKESVASSSPPVIATSSIPYTVLRPYAINPTLVGSTLKTLYPFTKFSHYDKLEGTRRHAVTALLLLCNGSTSLPLRPSDLSSFDKFQKNYTGTSRVKF